MQLVVSRMEEKVIEAKVILGLKVAESMLVPKINLITYNIPDLQLTRRQFPLKLSFVMIINKSLSQSLNRIHVYLPSPVLNHGQLLCHALSCFIPFELKELVFDGTYILPNVTKKCDVQRCLK